MFLATSIDQDWDGQKVNLMTMHASKGLEFDVVFLPGWEEVYFTSKIYGGKGGQGPRRRKKACLCRYY